MTSVEPEKTKDVVYFRHGHVSRVSPSISGDLYENRDIVYEADAIVSDGVPYNLMDKESIRSITIPAFGEGDNLGPGLGVTGSLDYDLRMRAGNHWNSGRYDLAIPCLEKSTEMMQQSGVGWRKKDYYRIVNHLIDLGCLKRAKQWEDWINRNIRDNIRTHDEVIKDVLELCDVMGTNLVVANNVRVCCEKCAKYRNRVFRIRGMDIRFPKLPKDYHTNCGLHLTTFCYGATPNPFPGRNIILHSNRPFIDDRTNDEKAAYYQKLIAIQKDENETLWARPNVSRTSYYLLKKYFPDDAPKSMSGFSRMRNAKCKQQTISGFN